MSYESEKQTRKQRVDPKLKAAGWRVAQYREGAPINSYGKAAAVEEFKTANGPADYLLCNDGVILGVVEAKKLTLGPQGVLTQSERYSKGIREEADTYLDGFKAPFLYSSNGEIIWHHDVRDRLNRSRQIRAFHTPAALQEFMGRNLDAELGTLLSDIPANAFMRPYQLEASEAVEQAIEARKRMMLLPMATGTGKTMTMVNQVYRLMKSGVARRVLFLVDRRALAVQAVRAFSSFQAEPGLKFHKLYELYNQKFLREDVEDEPFDSKLLPTKYLTDPQPGLAFVYVSTIQRMSINLFGRDAIFSGPDEQPEDETDKLDIPIHAFDLVIADECHRGYSAKQSSVWRDTLDHFDAIKIGLTATPAAHTKAYFNHIAYRYEYERAVQEGYLVDYDVVRVKSNVRMSGVFLKEGEQVEAVDTTSGQTQLDLLEDERHFETTKIEREITAPDSNKKILEELKKYAEAHEAEFGRFPKILIFAANDLPHTSHCDQLVNQARDLFGRGDSFVTKITGRVDRPLQRIREFRNRPNPGIVVSVDLMTTGIDIPDLDFIVFLRPVKSRILFEQMLGRGTRKGEKYPDKSHFVVFDCFDGTLLEYFRNSTAITAEPPEPDGKTIAQIIDEIWQNKDRDYNVRRLVKRLRRVDKQMSGDARVKFARFIPDGDVGGFAEGLGALLRLNFSEAMRILQDKNFQNLLLDYPRPPRTFLIAVEAQDVVESEWLIKGGTGQEYKPADYLAAFESYVRDNTEQVQAIAILLSKPQGWNPEALKALRDALSKAPEHFTETNLQRAYHVTHQKALVDIISMVKHAGTRTSLLLTATERVNEAVKRVTDGLALTIDQAKWVEYIRQHLVANLSINQDDFDYVPVLSNRGGWGRANQVFEGKLGQLLERVNEELVAA